MKRIFILSCLLTAVIAATAESDLQRKSWKDIATHMPKEWYGSQQAADIAENVLLYQRNVGGWPKNIQMHHPLSNEQKELLQKEKQANEAIFDNGATTQELRFLAKVYAMRPDIRYRSAFNCGLAFILKAQYPDSGGWPMFYPLRKKGYYDRITFNDNAIINLMHLLKDVYTDKDGMGTIADTAMMSAAKEAYQKGISCILRCQYIKDGVKTVWCAQHDEHTFLPAYGRPFEHPSFSGAESVGLIYLLMEQEEPSDDIKEAVESAVKWLDAHRLKGIRIVPYTNPAGEKDLKVVEDPNAPDLWARFYHLEKEVPIFGDYKTPPEVLFHFADIIKTGRRTGYKWYGQWPKKLIETDFPKWKKRWMK